MAVTFTVVKRDTNGSTRVVYADMVGPASYTTNGETLTVAQQVQLMPEVGIPSAVDFTKVLFFESEISTTTGYEASLDKTNNKMVYWQASATAGQVSAATNLSAVTVRVRFVYAPTPG